MNETPYWTWHLITGILILVFLGLHMAVMHLDSIVGIFNPAGGEPVAWKNVLYRSQSIGFMFTYILLLGVALYHGLYGLRTIIFELSPPKGLQNFLNGLFWVGGVILFTVGTWGNIVIFKSNF
jgi:succinate dehydrogenase hydrophobic anchor subunit